MNHLRAQWREAIRREAIAAHNGIRVRVKYVGPEKRDLFGTTNWVGTVLDGTGFRAFGSWGEFKDAIKSGRWRSKAGFTIKGEGETQFASTLEGLLKWSAPASNVGTVGIIEADLSGLPFKTFIDQVRFGDSAGGHDFGVQGEKGGYLWLPEEGATEGVIFPNTGLGIGIDGGVPLDQITRVYETEGKYPRLSVVRSWPFREWEKHIDRVKDPKPPPPPPRPIDIVWWQTSDGQMLPKGKPFFHDEIDFDTRTACKLSIRKVGDGFYYEFDGRAGTRHARAIMPDIIEAKATGTLKFSMAFAHEAQSIKAKPCPKCWPRL